jgi:hypothetical protein
LEGFAIQLRNSRLGPIDNVTFYSYYLSDVYNMADTMKNTVHRLFHLILIRTL